MLPLFPVQKIRSSKKAPISPAFFCESTDPRLHLCWLTLIYSPGAAGIGLAVGQLGLGIGSVVGHATLLSRALSNANLRLFVPKGLEIWYIPDVFSIFFQSADIYSIGKTVDVDNEVGVASASGRSDLLFGISPEERQARYGDLIAPLSRVLPPLQQNGRSDPIAMIGRGLSSRASQKKMQKAEKDSAKGKTKKSTSLEADLKWASLVPEDIYS